MLLLRYLKTYGYRLDKAKTLLKYSFDLRAKNQHIFTKRDFLSPEIQNVFNLWLVNGLKKNTKGINFVLQILVKWFQC